LHFNDPTQFSSWVNAHRNEAKECLFLIDYEFSRSQTNGLSVIAELGIASQSVLVTSHFEEQAIQVKCVELGVKLLPKSFAAMVPIEMA
jgi:hypothetical protein